MTTVFDCKANLVALLRDKVPTVQPDAEIGYGDQWAGAQRPFVCVWVGDAHFLKTTPATLGNGRIQEEYRVAIVIEMHRPADTQEEANAGAQNIYSHLQEWVRYGPANPNPLNLPGVITVMLTPTALGEAPNPQMTGRACVFVCELRVKARI